MIKTLHILNGDSLHHILQKEEVHGDYAIWREMLCEGKTVVNLESDAFRKARVDFFKKNYPEQSGSYDEAFGSQLAIIADAHLYDEINLWFEYDLFCHINLIACISFLKALGFKGKIYHICSGRIEGKQALQSLSQLSNEELLKHYENKTQLDNHDLFLADDLWRLYCGKDHLKLKPERAKDSNFKYLANCISAHKERFPHVSTGLNTLETNMLRLIRKYEIKTEHQLCGYMLNYQGYYGYGDLQILKMIARMRSFFKLENDLLVLTHQGNDVLDSKVNVLKKMKYTCRLGGVLKYGYNYNEQNHKLSKLS